MSAPVKSPGKPTTKLGATLFTPLDTVHQEAFVLTVRDVARAIIFLSFGVLLGVLAAWINAMNGRRRR